MQIRERDYIFQPRFPQIGANIHHLANPKIYIHIVMAPSSSEQYFSEDEDPDESEEEAGY